METKEVKKITKYDAIEVNEFVKGFVDAKEEVTNNIAELDRKIEEIDAKIEELNSKNVRKMTLEEKEAHKTEKAKYREEKSNYNKEKRQANSYFGKWEKEKERIHGRLNRDIEKIESKINEKKAQIQEYEKNMQENLEKIESIEDKKSTERDELILANRKLYKQISACKGVITRSNKKIIDLKEIAGNLEKDNPLDLSKEEELTIKRPTTLTIGEKYKLYLKNKEEKYGYYANARTDEEDKNFKDMDDLAKKLKEENEAELREKAKSDVEVEPELTEVEQVNTEEQKTASAKAEPVKATEPKTTSAKAEPVKATEPKTTSVKSEPTKTTEPKITGTKTELVKTVEPKTTSAKSEPVKTEEPKTTEVKTDGKDTVLQKYENDGYGKNALGWYFNPWQSEYDPLYDPHNDPEYNKDLIKIETKTKINTKDAALEKYENDGYGKNALGWYFNPWTNEYDENYDPHNDPEYNKDFVKPGKETEIESRTSFLKKLWNYIIKISSNIKQRIENLGKKQLTDGKTEKEDKKSKANKKQSLFSRTIDKIDKRIFGETEKTDELKINTSVFDEIDTSSLDESEFVPKAHVDEGKAIEAASKKAEEKEVGKDEEKMP